MKLKMKCKVLKQLEIMLVLIMIFFSVVSDSKRLLKKQNKEDEGDPEVPNFQYVDIFIDKESKIGPLDFLKFSHLTIDRKEHMIRLYASEDSKSSEHDILFEDLIISDRNFAFFYNSTELLRREYPKNKAYRTRKVRSILESIAKTLKHNAVNCLYMFTKSFENIENLQGNELNIDLNTFCFETSENRDLFARFLRKEYQTFLSVTKKEVNKLNFLDKSIFNKFNIKFMQLLHPNNINSNSDQSSFLQMGTLSYNNDGIVVTSRKSETCTNSKIHSFNYQNIKDCKLSLYSDGKKNSEARCCFKFNYDFKDVFKNQMVICSVPNKGYVCQLKNNFIMGKLKEKCINLVMSNILFVFNHFKHPKEALLGKVVINTDSTNYSSEFIYNNIYKFLELQSEKVTNSVTRVKEDIEKKIINLVEGLGRDFLIFIKSFKMSEFLKVILTKIVSHESSSSKNEYTIVTNGIQLDQIQVKSSEYNQYGVYSGTLSQSYTPPRNNSIENQDSKFSYIQVLDTCQKHPNYRKCVCAAYPFSFVCTKNFCDLNPDSSFCGLTYCKTNTSDNNNCACSHNPKSTSCMCSVYGNFEKQCFCNRYKNSVFCAKDFCQKNPKNNHLFCSCQRNPDGDECSKDYCKKNSEDKRCKCLINPHARECICESVSNLYECEDKIEEVKSRYNNYSYQKNKK